MACPQFTGAQLQRFSAAYGGSVAAIYPDSSVGVRSRQLGAPWALDRIDQTQLPLDGAFDYYNLGSGVHAYIVDTVGAQPGIAANSAQVIQLAHSSAWPTTRIKLSMSGVLRVLCLAGDQEERQERAVIQD